MKKYLVKLAQDEYISMLLQNWSQTHYERLSLVVLQFFRTDFPTEPLNFVKYFASFFRRNKTKIRCNYWENVKFVKKWSKQNWDLITDFLIHIWGWYWWLHMQKLLLSSLQKYFPVFFFFSKIQQNVNFVIVQKDCEKIQTFCNYFSVCISFWIDLQKK